LDLLGFDDVPVSYNPSVIARLEAVAILLGIVVHRSPHKKTTAGHL